ncbi:MAG: hypothetical protein JSW00_08370 [Thermoplasmata archaeon]|nr:MAG: hypothetical protein JSW00_08370 [Thermoplasmata archaeon]
MTSEMGNKILIIVAKRGYTGADREVFFHNIRGIRYSDLEKEVLALEREGYISIEWVGPSNFTVTITPKGVELVKTFDEDVWHKDIKALEVLNKAKHAKKSIFTQKVDYSKLLEEKIHVAEVGNLSNEIIEGIDEHIKAERISSSEVNNTGSIGVPALEEVIEDDDAEQEKGIKIKTVSGELESTLTEEGEVIQIKSDEAILKDDREGRIEVDKATKLEKRVKEKRISGEMESGTPVSEPMMVEAKKQKSKLPKEKVVSEIDSASILESASEPDSEPLTSVVVAEDEISPDFYRQIEDAIHFGESLLEEAEEIVAKPVLEPGELNCPWETGHKCHMIKSGKFGDIDSPTINHCIICQLMEIKGLLKKVSHSGRL